MEEKVDVVINVYGKPYQTAITLLSLLKHSGDLIDKIYFIQELKQPKKEKFDFLFDLLKDKIIIFTPAQWLWTNQIKKAELKNADYRLSIRYQYGWEKSNKKFLFLTHNDVLYKDNIIKILFENIENNIAVGRVGQCGNCPAYTAKVCYRNNYWDYRPDKNELKNLIETHGSRRVSNYDEILKLNNAWPLPECRLNEWVALINLKIAREITMPLGSAMPFGAYAGLDVGTQWFYDVSHKGHKVKHYDFTQIAVHGWTNELSNGHSALSNNALYEKSELLAKDILIKDFGLSPESLSVKKTFSIDTLLSLFKN